MAVYGKLTLKHALGLAAPHTWVASVFPVLLGAALAFAKAGSFPLPVFALVLMASVLLQASVNTINDYYDFIKGNDRLENSGDPADAILVYNDLDPEQVRRLGFCFMVAAVLLGLYPVYLGGIVTLVIGVCGCLVIVAYSAGKTPISYLPLGEIVSGLVMGGLITAAVFSSLTGYMAGDIFFLSTPLILGIGLIMMTNNICDIERDAPTGRRTLPLLLGRPLARVVYRCCVGLWLLLVVLCIALRFRGGLIPVSMLLLAAFPLWRRLICLPFTPEQRGPAMGAIVKANLYAGTLYVAGILIHAIK
ncbi:MAG: prenyltransferase [Clostridiales bacterium]|nr:prenyltransferase [Clostridiales bacterium]